MDFVQKTFDAAFRTLYKPALSLPRRERPC